MTNLVMQRSNSGYFQKEKLSFGKIELSYQWVFIHESIWFFPFCHILKDLHSYDGISARILVSNITKQNSLLNGFNSLATLSNKLFCWEWKTQIINIHTMGRDMIKFSRISRNKQLKFLMINWIPHPNKT